MMQTQKIQLSKTKKNLLKLSLFCLIFCFSINLTLAEEGDPPAPTCTEIGTYTTSTNPDIAICRNFTYRKPLEFLNAEAEPAEPAEPEAYSALEDNSALWSDAENSKRQAYCKVIDCLKDRLNLNDRGGITPQECSYQEYNYNNFGDPKCETEGLQCKVTGAGIEYYPDPDTARIERQVGENQNCTIDTDKEKCLLALPTKITECNACRDSINRFIDNPSSAEPDESCQQYRGVTNCSAVFTCSTGSTPEIITDRTPYGTEFFDVTSTEKGLSTRTDGNFTVNAEGGGIVGTINTIANFLVKMISVLSLIIFIIGAFLLVIANGEENQINRGKDALKLSLLGIVIVMLSYTIVVLVQSIFF